MGINFLFTGLLGGCLLLAILLFFRETLKEKSHYNPIKKFPASFIKPFLNLRFLGFAGLITFSWASYYVFMSLSSNWLQSDFNYSEQDYSYIMALIGLGYLLGTYVTKKLSKKYSVEKILRKGLFIYLFFVIIIIVSYLLNSDLFIVISMIFILSSIGFLMPTSQVGAMNTGISNLGWAMGCLFCVEFLISGVFVYGFGLLESFQLGFGIILCLITTIILLYVSYRFSVSNE